MRAATRWIVGFGLLFVSLLLLIWGNWPASYEIRLKHMLAEEPQPPTAGDGAPNVPEAGQFRLEFPSRLRSGESGEVRLELIPGPVNTAASGAGRVVSNPLLEAQLDLAGFSVFPPGEISQPATPGEVTVFQWRVQPSEAGRYEGRLWVHLRFVPEFGAPAEVEENRRVLTVQRIVVRVVSVLGLDETQTRLAGLLVFGAGLLVLMEPALEWLRSRRMD